jgi:L-ascorbate metabolism protein UlaG (beta-lactamase superfamily)
MLLIKKAHSCIRLEKDRQALVIDPGGLTDPEVFTNAEAVLITHEHWDHFEEGRLRNAMDTSPGLRLWTVRSVAEKMSGYGKRVTTVGPGDSFMAAGFEVEAHGAMHALLHRAVPRILNTGFEIDGAVFHPGDAFTVPFRPVDTLILPIHARWSTEADVVDYLGEIKPKRAIIAHEGMLHDFAIQLYGELIRLVEPNVDYQELKPNDTITIN